MKILKCLTVSLALTMLLASCDSRKDYFYEVNKAPILSLTKNGVELTGSTLSDSLKIGEAYALRYSIIDEEKVSAKTIQEQGENTTSIGAETITINGSTEGQSRLIIEAKDSFGAKADFSVSFTMFRNLAPVAAFSVTKIGISSPYEYEVDATASFDKDAKFNGHIVEYEYTLQNYVLSTTLNKIRYIFGSAGQKKISVRVKDNTGDWSEQVSKYIVLE